MSRVTRLMALFAQVLAVAATAYCAVVFSYAYVFPNGRINWLPFAYFLFMNAFCLYAVWVMWSRPPNLLVCRSVWVTQGLFLGFIIAGSWSIGLFFAPSWLILTVLAVVDLVRTRTNLLLSVALIVLMMGLAVAQTAYLVIAPRIIFSPMPSRGFVPARPAPTATPRP